VQSGRRSLNVFQKTHRLDRRLGGLVKYRQEGLD
jgi:hypothetical protein